MIIYWLGQRYCSVSSINNVMHIQYWTLDRRAFPDSNQISKVKSIIGTICIILIDCFIFCSSANKPTWPLLVFHVHFGQIGLHGGLGTIPIVPWPTRRHNNLPTFSNTPVNMMTAHFEALQSLLSALPFKIDSSRLLYWERNVRCWVF